MKLHKQIIQDLINSLTENRVGRAIRTRVIPNLGVHTFIDRHVLTFTCVFYDKTGWQSAKYDKIQGGVCKPGF